MRGLEYRERRSLHSGFAYPAHPVQVLKHVVAHLKTEADGFALRQIDDHGGNGGIESFQFNSAHEVRCILAARKAPRFIRGCLVRQHVYAGATHSPVPDGVGVYGYEQVGVALAGNGIAVTEFQEVITITR